MSDASTPMSIRLLFGGLSGMGATCFVHPMDVLKNRMQMQGEGSRVREYKTSLHALAAIIRNEGLAASYAGLTAGLLRQATYATVRLGLYTSLLAKFSTKTPEGKVILPNFLQKVGISVIAGGCGAFVGTPAEVCLIRMTLDGKLPPEQRRNYRNVGHALYRVAADEGVLALWRGCGPTIIRAAVTNIAQLASYSQSKQFLLQTMQMPDNILVHFGASMISGLLTAYASLPVDIAKTRIQNMRIIDGKPEYRGMLDVIGRVIRTEGVLSLWKGFTPYYMRIGPHTVLLFLFLEQMNSAYATFTGKEKIGGL